MIGTCGPKSFFPVADLPGGHKAVDDRHLHIHQDRVEMITGSGAARFLAAALLALGCMAASAAVGGVRINISRSLPLGAYARTNDPHAKLIEFCPPEPFPAESSACGYRTHGTACPDGAQPVLNLWWPWPEIVWLSPPMGCASTDAFCARRLELRMLPSLPDRCGQTGADRSPGRAHRV
jgi:hypothetical protein